MSVSSADEILITRDGPVATVTLNRPESHNAISYRMWQRLCEVVGESGEDPAVRVVVFRGGGEKAFSAGADIKDFPENRHDSESAKRYAQAFDGALDAIDELEVPTISMIRGICVGGGLELATATDIRIAATGSTFGVPVARLGIVAGFKEMRRIVRLVGTGQASYIVLSGELIDAQEAYRIGLVTRLVAPESLESETYELAARIADLAPVSHADNKAIIRAVEEDPGLERLGAESMRLQYRVFDTDDFQEGMTAFMEKRKPRFTGR